MNRSRNLADTIHFKNENHTFKAVITPDSYGYSIKFGGSYEKCITISITIVDGVPQYGNISHIQSEQECTLDTLLLHEETTNFVKACLQFCSMKFPGLKRFIFDDMSNIECGVSPSEKPPRRLGKPFSLAPLYIAINGKTWYEMKFGAKMENPETYKKYQESMELLSKPKDMEFSKFKQINKLSPEQEALLEPLYSAALTWTDFFKSIPRIQRCLAMYNWLPTFITRSLAIKFQNNNWYIDIDMMDTIPVEILGSRSASRGVTMGGRRKTRSKRTKTKRSYRLFTNQMEGWKLSI